jgi:hypothetical protein
VALWPASRAACTASQSNNPAASARADMPIIPRKKRKVFQSRIKVEKASAGAINPRRSRTTAPTIAIMASFQRNGRVIIPIRVASPIKQVRLVFQISGTEKKKNMMVLR